MTHLPLSLRGRIDPWKDHVELQVSHGLSIAEMIALLPVHVPDDFWDYGIVRINDNVIHNEYWNHVRPKPSSVEVPIIISFEKGDYEGGGKQGTKQTLALVATIAVIAGAAFISGGGLPLLGIPALAGFTAGSLSATVAAAAFGIAGQLAIAVLIPPPTVAGPKNETNQTNKTAGVQGNSVRINQYLPGVCGDLVYSPPFIAKPYSYRLNRQTVIEAMFGVGNRCLITELALNDAPADDLSDSVTYEIREGTPGQTRFANFANKTVDESQVGDELTGFVTKTNNWTKLLHPLTPLIDYPKKRIYRSTWNDWDEMRFRISLPSGVVKNATASGPEKAVIPVRMQMRKVGDVAWTNLPTLMFTDESLGKAQLQFEIALKRATMRTLTLADTDTAYGWDETFEAFAAYYDFNPTETFRFTADDSFNGQCRTPIMTAATTGAVTVSASSQQVGSEAWRAFDSSISLSAGTVWKSAAGVTTASILVDLGAPKKFKFVNFNGLTGLSNNFPAVYLGEGSNDNINWTTFEPASTPIAAGFIGKTSVLPEVQEWRYVRYTFTGTTNGGTFLALTNIIIANSGPACRLDINTPTNGPIYSHTTPFAGNTILTQDGVEIYLDDDAFPAGFAYELQVWRGTALAFADWDQVSQAYNGGTIKANFFEAFDNDPPNGDWTLRADASKTPSLSLLDVFQTWKNVYPVNCDDLPFSQIAIKIIDQDIKSVSARFQSVVPVWDGTWSTQGPTANPAALYRYFCWQEGKPWLVPGELLNEVNLEDWYNVCVAADYECNLIIDQDKVFPLLGVIASCGQAVPHMHEQVGVIIDRDRSSEAPKQVFTPKNTRAFTIQKSFSSLPHGIMAQYQEESDNYATKMIISYFDDYDVNNANDFHIIDYRGFTKGAKVTAKALFDGRQLTKRPVKFIFEAPYQTLITDKGDLVGLTFRMLDRWQAHSHVKDIEITGGNVTAVTLEDYVDLSLATGDIGSVEDMGDVTDVATIDPDYNCIIQRGNNTTSFHQVIEKTRTRRITFTTPFAKTDDFEAGLIIAFGVGTKVSRRCVILSIEYVSEWVRRLTLVDEAPEIYA